MQRDAMARRNPEEASENVCLFCVFYFSEILSIIVDITF